MMVADPGSVVVDLASYRRARERRRDWWPPSAVMWTWDQAAASVAGRWDAS